MNNNTILKNKKQKSKHTIYAIVREYMNNTAEEFRKYIESEVLLIIRQLANSKTTTSDRVKEMARETLLLIRPNMSLEDLYANAVKLDDKFTELAPIVFKIMKKYEEEYSMKAINSVSALIKSGRYDDAQNMVKKVLLFKSA
jgi:hypothetical protein